MLSTGDLIVEEARVHFPTVVNFLGVNVTWPFEHQELDDSVAKALGAVGGRGHDGRAADHRRRRQRRGRGHGHARRRRLAPARGRRRRRPGRHHQPGRHRQGHRRIGHRGGDDPQAPTPTASMRAARADVDLDAVAHNVAVLRALVAPAELCAVVKADGYGHGAIAVGQAALDAGRRLAGRGPGRGGRGAAPGRHRGARSCCCPQPRPDDIDAAVRLRPAPERLHGGGRRRPWPTAAARDGPRWPACTSRSTPG